MRGKLFWVLFTTSIFALIGAEAGNTEERAQAVLSGIWQESDGNSTRLTIESNAPLTYTYYSPDPLTLVMDIPEVDAAKVPAKINVGSREVEAVRVTNMARADGRRLVRLEIRLANLAPYQIFSADNRLTVLFESPGADSRPAANASERLPISATATGQESASERAREVPSVDRRDFEEQAAVEKSESPIRTQSPPTSTHPASALLDVSYISAQGRLEVVLSADGRLRYQDFFLANPDRLVVDLTDVMVQSSTKRLDIDHEFVRRIRMSQFSASSPKVARVVFDLTSRSEYRIVEGSDGIKVLFGEGERASPEPLAALGPAPDMVSSAVIESVVPAPPTLETLPAMQILPSDSFEGREIGPADKPFIGHPISMDFKDGDLQDIFRLFADISGLNIVVNPGVSGKVTLKLTEVPWDQALDLILRTNSLGYSQEGNVIRIAKLTDLQREEKEKRDLQAEKELAGDLQVWRKTLSYAKAKGLEPTVKSVALSARGNITIDERTNTMIITDLPRFIEQAKDLIADLDRANPQVEIEARIVVTTRNFTRELGIQWGFMNQMTPAFGTTTNRSFPHSMIINGAGVRSDGGLMADQGEGLIEPPLASSQGIGVAGRGYAVNVPTGEAPNTGIGISMGNIGGSFSLDAALSALEKQGRGRILSTPRVTTQ
ncbi:MAG: AMIN domain-containing protein, partial [Vicinamibacteria bacterium]|nr:AMIN domain-containing protein [Vicinamibacteria bacterium]